MARVDDLRHQHDKLHAGVASVALLRDRLNNLRVDAVRAGLDQALAFFRHEVAPHARAEEAVLYPEVARMLGVHLGEKLVGEHHQMSRLVAKVTESRHRLAVDGCVPPELHRELTTLVDVMSAHLRQEEEVLLRMLDEHLTEAEAYSLYERMEEATFAAVVALSRPAASSDVQ